MNFRDEALLSFYEEIAVLNKHKHVSLVRHVETGIVYVKKILSIFDRELYAALKQLNIPGIPKIFLIAEDDDQLIIIEEYINGISLDRYMEEHGIFHEKTALSIIDQLCETLDVLHHANPPIIHRDIKPSNIMITEDLTVTLIDFNAAKTFDHRKKQDTILMGTVDYAAPEQYGFGQSDARTDLYGLGNLLNIMLTGHLPKEQLYEGRLSRVIRKCTNLDPGKRYRSAKQLQHALFTPSCSFTPPGFRTRRLWKMLLAVLGYAAIIDLSVTTQFENVTSVPSIIIYRFITFIMLLCPVVIVSNYRGICSRLPLLKGTHTVVRFLCKLLWSAIFMIGAIILAAILIMIVDPSQMNPVQ